MFAKIICFSKNQVGFDKTNEDCILTATCIALYCKLENGGIAFQKGFMKKHEYC